MIQRVFTLKNNVSSENIFFYKIRALIVGLFLILDCDVIIFVWSVRRCLSVCVETIHKNTVCSCNSRYPFQYPQEH